jgi:hypothetical protein
MANPQKLSQLNAVTTTTNESLVYVANSTDGGSSFTGKNITFQNLVSEMLAKSDLGVFTGATVSDNATVKQVLQDIEDELESQSGAKAELSAVNEIDGNVNDLISLSGVAENASDMGTFTGSVITDSSTVKAALQELETALEAQAAAGATALTTAIDNLVDGAPGALDTLNEIAAAIADDENIATTLTTAISTEASARAAAVTAENQARVASDLLLTTNKVARGENVDELVASTTPVTSPATYYFLVVDASDGSIKVVDKNFMEID